MSITLSLAAALMALTGLVHLIVGGRDVVVPVRRAELSAELTLYFLLCWHFITAFFFVGAAAFALAAAMPNLVPLALGFAALSAAMGVLFLAFGLLQLGTIWRAPQWTVLLLIAALALPSLGGAA